MSYYAAMHFPGLDYCNKFCLHIPYGTRPSFVRVSAIIELHHPTCHTWDYDHPFVCPWAIFSIIYSTRMFLWRMVWVVLFVEMKMCFRSCLRKNNDLLIYCTIFYFAGNENENCACNSHSRTCKCCAKLNFPKIGIINQTGCINISYQSNNENGLFLQFYHNQQLVYNRTTTSN